MRKEVVIVSQEYEKRGKDLLSKLSRTIKSGAETLMQETRELTRVGKLKMELLSLENERGRKFEEIGRLAHTLHKQGADFDQLNQHFAVIDEIEAKIDAKNKEIDRIPAEETLRPDGKPEDTQEAESACASPDEFELHMWCSQCGAPVGDDDKFCSKCGNPLIA
ncbi:MAG TPA: zinc ribbon domain-containing protein [Firmicutes bacterium]|nr:zinc ribbon domain-containing protein [Candidatus Fermentithermobacillaceae bacterium]